MRWLNPYIVVLSGIFFDNDNEDLPNTRALGISDTNSDNAICTLQGKIPKRSANQARVHSGGGFSNALIPAFALAMRK